MANASDDAIEFNPDLESERKAAEREKLERAALVFGFLRKLADDATVFKLGRLITGDGWVLAPGGWQDVEVRVVSVSGSSRPETKWGTNYEDGWVQIQFEIIGPTMGLNGNDGSPYVYVRSASSLDLSELITP